jgi:uncharacterized protein YrzB (UPF0473 family)
MNEEEKIYDINEEDLDTMELELDDGTKLTCVVLGIFDLDEYPDKEYIALLPNEEEEVLLYQYNEGEDGESFILDNIETDEEFAAVEEAFLEFMDSEAGEFEAEDTEE